MNDEQRRSRAARHAVMLDELRSSLVDDSEAVLHALYCGNCSLEATADNALRLVEWNRAEFLEALARRERLSGH